MGWDPVGAGNGWDDGVKVEYQMVGMMGWGVGDGLDDQLGVGVRDGLDDWVGAEQKIGGIVPIGGRVKDGWGDGVG